MQFEDLLEELESGRTFEEVCKEQNNEVECIGNMAYDDDNLYEFFQKLGVSSTDFGVGYALIYTSNGKVYELPYEERANRFDSNLPDETVLFFDNDNIYDVTESYVDSKDNFTECSASVPEAYKTDFQNLIKNKRDAILYEIECIIDEHGEGTSKEDDAREYERFLRSILKSIE